MTWKKLEASIQERADYFLHTGQRYAFFVVITEEEYQQLKRLYKTTEFLRPMDYPWCYLKLLTEAYVRSYEDTDDKKIRKNMAHELEVMSSYKSLAEPRCWKYIIDILDILKLNVVGREGWRYYKNIVAQSGVPLAYFEEIFSEAERLIKRYNTPDRAIENINENFFENKLFSTFFRDVFGRDDGARKALIGWFIHLVVLSKKYDLKNLSVDLIPAHLLQHSLLQARFKEFTRQKHSQQLQSIDAIQKQEGFFFDENSGSVKYLLQLDTPISQESLNLQNTFRHWEYNLNLCYENQQRQLELHVKPNDFAKWPTTKKLRHTTQNMPCKLPNIVDCLVFDQQGRLIPSSKTDIAFNDVLFVLSRFALDELGDPDEDFLHDDWYQWFFYRINNKKISKLYNSKIKLLKPYSSIRLLKDKQEKRTPGKWVSSAYLGQHCGFPIFGGDSFPIFEPQQETQEDYHKQPCIALFYDMQGEQILQQNARFKNGYWVIDAADSIKIGSAYQIQLIQIGSGLKESKSDFCIWYSNLHLQYTDSLLAPHEACQISLKLPEQWKYAGVIGNNFPQPVQQQSNEIHWHLDRKPSDCNPIITLKNACLNSKEAFLNLPLRLPYLTAWISSKNTLSDSTRLEWSPNTPFTPEQIQTLFSEDSGARIYFYFHGRTSVEALLIDEQENIIREIELITPKGFVSSIALGEMTYFQHLSLKLISKTYDLLTLNIEKHKKINKNIFFDKIYQESIRRLYHERQCFIKF